MNHEQAVHNALQGQWQWAIAHDNSKSWQDVMCFLSGMETGLIYFASEDNHAEYSEDLHLLWCIALRRS